MNEHIMQFFAYAHLPSHLQEVSKPFGEMAQKIVDTIPRNPERTVALRKLLESNALPETRAHRGRGCGISHVEGRTIGSERHGGNVKKRRKNTTSNDVTLGEVPERILREAIGFMHGEVIACDDGICPDQRAAFVALFNAGVSELRRRGRKWACPLPPPPIGPDK